MRLRARCSPHAPIVADIDAGKREAALKAGAAAAYDPADPDARKALLKATGGVYGAVDFVGSDGSLAFAAGSLAKGGKVVITGLLGGTYTTPIAMFPLRVFTIEGTMTGTLDEANEMMALARAGKDPAGADHRTAARRRAGFARRSARRARSSAAWCWCRNGRSPDAARRVEDAPRRNPGPEVRAARTPDCARGRPLAVRGCIRATRVGVAAGNDAHDRADVELPSRRRCPPYNSTQVENAPAHHGRTAVTSISTSQPGLTRPATAITERDGKFGCCAVPKNWV